MTTKQIALLKLIIILSSTLLFSTLFAQEKNSNEIIAEGGSKRKVRPDLVTFTLTIEKTDTLEKRVLEKLNLEVEDLVKTLYKVGFTNSTIKIADYDISSSLNNNHKKAYTASNVLRLEFGLDTKLINQLYKEIQGATLNDLDISFETKLSDSLEKNTRRILVQQALADAELNANNIAKTLKINIVGVKQVLKYAPGLIDRDKMEIIKFTPPKIVNDEEISYNTSFDKFQVEDVELEEKITIVYEFSK